MIFIVCALQCEANPLISYFHLKRSKESLAFPVYTNASIVLIVAGVGKIQTAAAIGYLHALQGNIAHTAWLNVGVAGHATLPLGTGVLAHQIIDQGSGRKYYPMFVTARPVQTETIWTVDRPENGYENLQAVYDMEASAFWSVASRFTTAELIHCYKIISDNRLNATSFVTKQQVEVLIEGHLTHIENFIKNLQVVRQSLVDLELSPKDVEPFLKQWHFTKTQQLKLQNLLQRWRACTSQTITSLWDPHLLANLKSQHVLQYLEQQLR